MRIDKPICKYGEANCRKHFDGNCMVENDFELRCPIERTINEVLDIIDKESRYISSKEAYRNAACQDYWRSITSIRRAIEELRGNNKQ